MNIYIITYEDNKRTERSWDDLTSKEKKVLAEELTSRFMKRAGFSPIKVTGESTV